MPTLHGNKSTRALTLVDIPKIDKVLAWLHSSKIFTILDLKCRYYHIKSSPQTGHKKCFTTIFGKYGFLRKPFGIAQWPVYFTALMQNVFGAFGDLFLSHGWCVGTQFW